MHITSLQLRRFGKRSELQCHGLASGLNVLYGPNKVGKATLSRMIRVIFTGCGSEDHESRLPRDESGSPGTITVQTNLGARVLQRQLGDPAAQLQIGLENGSDTTTRDLPNLFGNSQPLQWEAAFFIDFERRRGIATLVQQAIENGLRLVESPTQLPRLDEIALSLKQYRHTLDQLPISPEPVESLRERSQFLQIAMDQAEAQSEQSRTRSVQQRKMLETAMLDSEQRISELTIALGVIDSRLQSMRSSERVSSETSIATPAVSGSEPDRIRQNLHEIESQLYRWRRVLDELGMSIDLLAIRRHELLQKIGDVRSDLAESSRGHVDLSHAVKSIHEISRHGSLVSLAESRELSNAEKERARTLRELEECRAQRAACERQIHNLDGVCSTNNDQALQERRIELDRVNEAIQLADRRCQTVASIVQLEQESHELLALGRTPEIIQYACQLVSRFSCDELKRVQVQEDFSVLVTDRHGDCRSATRLNPADSDVVYLSLSLAIVAAWRRKGVNLPVVLDELFTNLDSERVQRAIQVLADASKSCQQIVVFTSQQQVAETMDRSVATLFDLTRLPLTPVASSPEPAEPIPSSVASGDDDRSHPKAHHAASSSGQFYLSEEQPVEAAPSIDEFNASHLRRVGVRSIGDLCRIIPNDVVGKLRGTAISLSTITCWQDEAKLVCRVPNLRPYDARILVTCGIRRPDELAGISPAELRQRIDAFSRTPEGHDLMHAGSEFESSRLFRWLEGGGRHVARLAFSAPERRTSEIRSSCEINDRDRRQSRRPANRSDKSLSGALERERADATAGAAEAGSPDDGQASRKSRPRQGSQLNKSSFHLDLTDPVGCILPMGPRVASSMSSIGIATVGSFLSAQADELAEKLGNRRIKPDTIRAWQCQAELASRVSGLRIQDAQILVACGVQSPEQLATGNVAELSKKVTRFVGSIEGKRMFPNGEGPSARDLTKWIQRARGSRERRAA